MGTAEEYRELAAEGYHLAATAKTEEQRKVLEEMARAWRELADELETKIDQQQ